MPPGAGPFYLIGLLIAVPFVLLRHIFRLIALLFRLRRQWRQVPLHEKNRVRATAGAAALVGCLALAITGFPVVGAKATGIIAAMAVLYLVVGIRGSHGAQYDFFSAFWYAATVIGSVALLVFIRLHAL